MTRAEEIGHLSALWARDDISVNETIALEMAIKTIKDEPIKRPESAFERKVRMSQYESAYLDQGITQGIV